MKINHQIIMILLFVAAVGICAGSFFEVHMTGEGKEELESILGNLLNHAGEPGSPSTSDSPSASAFPSTSPSFSFGRCFINSLKNNLLLVIAAYVSPIIFITLPLLPLLILLKGISVGFSSAMTLEIIGLKGVFYLLTAVIPQNIIQFPVLCFLVCASLQAGFINGKSILYPGNTNAKRKRKALHFDARRYSYIYLAGTGLIIISCLLEAFLLQLKL